jgi:DNA-binding CsgD family transcriptional regulator
MAAATGDHGVLAQRVTSRVSEIESEIGQLDQRRGELIAELDAMVGVSNSGGTALTRGASRQRPASRAPASTTGRRRRGRPPGSKNKPKGDQSQAADASAATTTATGTRQRRRSSNGRRRGRSNVSVEERQSQLVDLLAQGGKTRKELADLLNVSATRVEQLIRPLADSGQVRSERDPTSQRNRQIWSMA